MPLALDGYRFVASFSVLHERFTLAGHRYQGTMSAALCTRGCWQPYTSSGRGAAAHLGHLAHLALYEGASVVGHPHCGPRPSVWYHGGASGF